MDSRFRGNDLGVVIPAEAGIHAALTEDERVVAGTGGEIPCATAGAGPLTVAGFHFAERDDIYVIGDMFPYFPYPASAPFARAVPPRSRTR